MPLNSKTIERHKEAPAAAKRANSKPAMRVQPLDKQLVKRKSTNSIASNDLTPKVGIDAPKPAAKSLSRRATMESLSPISSVAAANPRFAALGRKVKSLVRCKLAFQIKTKSNNGGIERANTMDVIHKMPTEARFSSFMSPEAQYSMMKGYEDVLHNQLVESNPECDTFLVRNKTPINLIGIRKQTTGASNLETTMEIDDEDLRHSEDEDDRNQDDKSDQDSVSQKAAEQVRPSVTSTMTTSSLSETPSKLQRTQSLQGIIPHDRRLALTYRLESAMDILDTIRHKHGQVPLSPRIVQKSRDITPVTDYNAWAAVWCKEFNTKA